MLTEMSPIQADLTVEDLIDRFPATARVFIRRRMPCVGCELARFTTIAEVCQIYRQSLEEFLAELRKTAGTATGDATSKRRSARKKGDE